MKNQPVNIVGGGIAGMTIAMTLKKLGVDYHLFEKNISLNYEDVGLGISANIFPILKSLDIFNETKMIGSFIQKFHFVDKKGRNLKTFQLKNPALSVRRSSFYKMIADKLEEDKVQLGKIIDPSDFKKSEIVIYANGIDSNIRNERHPSIHLRDSQQSLWRGISNIKLPEKYKNAYHDFLGENSRFAIIHTGDNFYSWYLVKEFNKTSNLEITSKKDVKNLMTGYPEVIQKVIENSSGVFYSRLMDINPKWRKNIKWHFDSSILIGDAIHPTTPNMANGACLAIEDGFLLGNLLVENSSVEKAFEIFQREREKKINKKVVNQSWVFGKSMHWSSKIMTWLTKKVIQITPQILFDKTYSSILNEGKLLPRIYKKY